MKWQPISELNITDRTMFVVKAFNTPAMNGYTSDPWCVWKEGDCFARWPHQFPPTHFLMLPKLEEPCAP